MPFWIKYIKENQVSERIIVALDLKGYDNIVNLVDSLKGAVWFKVGAVNFTAYGVSLIKELKKRDKKIFLDLKYHDIPNTVKGAVEAAASLGVDMLTVHSIGGVEMMAKAKEAVKEFEDKNGVKGPEIVAVTVLTSMNDDNLKRDMFIELNVKEMVLKLAKNALNAGISAIVASAKETELLRENFGDYFKIITPGIRPVWAAKNDQKRVVTPGDAVKLGSNYIVIGRPIYGHENPQKAFELIRKELEDVNT